MTTATAPEKTTPPPEHHYSPLAALLSYLVPGLGQMYQGRVAKGLLFLFSLYGLFFYGMYLGSWSNVYYREPVKSGVGTSRNALANLIDRLPLYGQLPIGVVAWPAVWQANTPPLPPVWKEWMKMPPENHGDDPSWKGKSLNELQSEGDKFWDLGTIYTIIAGVLNILVIYDAFAGPAFVGADEDEEEKEPAQRQEVAA